jgi:hypothetical protein
MDGLWAFAQKIGVSFDAGKYHLLNESPNQHYARNPSVDDTLKHLGTCGGYRYTLGALCEAERYVLERRF